MQESQREDHRRDEADEKVRYFWNVTKTQPIVTAFEDVGRESLAKEWG